MTAEKPLFARLTMLLLALVFAVQSFAVQTHIHGQPVTALAHITHVSSPAVPAPRDPYDPANCPLCQEMLHAGVYVVPVVADFLVILNAVAFAPAFILLPHAATERQHSWQSRAPPRR
ncbi:MAG: hypothetical protein ACXWLJ_11795 [Rhizomicrobium sp.]